MAVSANAFASQAGAIAVGSAATATGLRASALGYRSGADGINGLALGGDSDDADSKGAYAGAIDSTAVGTDASATGVQATALGKGAQAGAAQGATALGYNSIALAEGAVALGANSVADIANTVSVGSAEIKRQIKNVASGFSDFDAVNVAQLNNVRIQSARAEVPSRYIRVNSSAAAPAATAVGAIALGGYAIASGVDSIAIGSNGAGGADTRIAAAQAAGAVAVGGQSRANKEHATALGYRANAGEAYSLAIGAFAQANFANSLALGYMASAVRANQMMLGTAHYTYTMPGLPKDASNNAQSGSLYYVTVDADGNLGYAPSPIGTASMQTASEIAQSASVPATATASTRNNQTSSDPAASPTSTPVMAAQQTASLPESHEPVTVAKLGDSQDVAEPSVSQTTAGRTAIRSASAGAEAAGTPSIAAITDAQFSALSGRVSSIEDRLNKFDLRLEGLEGGIAAAMALGSAIVVPDSTFSVSVNAATYGGEQAIAGSLIGKLSQKVYVSAGVSGNTGDDNVGGQVGVAFGF